MGKGKLSPKKRRKQIKQAEQGAVRAIKAGGKINLSKASDFTVAAAANLAPDPEFKGQAAAEQLSRTVNPRKRNTGSFR
jgi:hypothetical protein